MALGDGVRRHIAKVSDEERARFSSTIVKLDTTKFFPDGVSLWDKQEDVHKNTHFDCVGVHSGRGFIPWHRVIVNRLRGLIREVHLALSLHWDWTTDPQPNAGGRTPLFRAQASFTNLSAVGLMALATLALPPGATAATVTLDFDAPQYSNGNSISLVGDIGFRPAAIVFTPAHVPTFSGTQALKVASVCTAPDCPNGTYRMVIRFGQPLPGSANAMLWRRADSVSMRIGADAINTACFPEGTSCAIYARLSGFDDQGNRVADSQDVFVVDASTTIAAGLAAPITREIHVSDPFARIVSVALVYGRDTFSHDSIAFPLPGEPQIDHLVVNFPDTLPPQQPPPAAPSVQITEPVNSSQRHAPYQTRLRGSVTVPGGIAAFCYRLNASPGAIGAADCKNNADLKPDLSFDVPITDDSLKAGANTLSVTVHDLWGHNGSAAVSFSTMPPSPPHITIWSPGDFQWLDATNPTYLNGAVQTVGRLQGFCVLIDAAVAPAPNACTQDLAAIGPGNPAVQPLNFGTFLASSRFSSGAHKVSVFAVDRWNQVGRADITVNLPTDFRIVGMEISQAIQTPAIPLNVNGSAQYSGVRLRQRVPTVVRVFANTPFSGNYCCFSMLLSGFVPDPQLGEKQLGSLLPDSTPKNLTTGNIDVPLAMRADPNGGFVFTLPKDWTLQNGLRLKAKLQLPLSLRECASCGGNNEFSVTNINFEPPPGLTISPVILSFVSGGMTFAPPASPTVLFAPVINISPVPSSNVVVMPYAGTIDVSDVVSSSGGCKNINTTCQDTVFGRVVAFERTNHPGYTIGVGPIDVGLEQLNSIDYGTHLGAESIAIADSRLLLTAVGHEFYHEMYYYHAGPGGTASPCKPADLFNLWPPDQKGYIHGVGLDRRPWRDSSGYWNGQYRILMPGTQGMPGGQAEYYDLMSYCAAEDTAWISAENWNSFGGTFPNGLLPDSLFVGQATATISQGSAARREDSVEAQGGALLVSAVLQKDGSLGTFRSIHAGNLLRAHPAKSDYLFVVRDANRHELARVPAIVISPRGHGPAGTHLDAFVPAKDAASVEVEHHGRTIAKLARSAKAPEVSMGSPQAGASLSRDESLKVAWSAIDADSQALEVRIEYSAARDKPFHSVFVGPNRGEWSVPGSMLEAATQGRLRLVASDGFNETVAEIGPITVRASAPQLEILAPAANTAFPHTTPVRLQAAAFGNDRLPLADDKFEWSVDGRAMRNGADAEVRDLETGTHTAKVVAYDGDLTSVREVKFAIRNQATAMPSDPETPSYYWRWRYLLYIALALIVVGIGRSMVRTR